MSVNCVIFINGNMNRNRISKNNILWLSFSLAIRNQEKVRVSFNYVNNNKWKWFLKQNSIEQFWFKQKKKEIKYTYRIESFSDNSIIIYIHWNQKNAIYILYTHTQTQTQILYIMAMHLSWKKQSIFSNGT